MNTERTAKMNLHLTEDQLDEVLMGVASPDLSQHLSECEVCGEQLRVFQGTMAAFNQASRAWSEARSNGISRDIAALRPKHRLTRATVWSTAAAAMAVLVFGLATSLHQSQQSIDSAYTHPDHDQRELATDNAMLAAIDSEIGTPHPAQFGIYERAKAHVVSGQRQGTGQVRN